jgi:hypothetical protein
LQLRRIIASKKIASAAGWDVAVGFADCTALGNFCMEHLDSFNADLTTFRLRKFRIKSVQNGRAKHFSPPIRLIVGLANPT